MTAAQSAKIREEFIRAQQKALGKKITSLEQKMYSSILDKLIKELDVTPDGKIISNGKNVELSSVLNKIFKSIQQNELLDVIKAFSKDFTGVLELNASYFAILEADKKKLATIKKSTEETMRKRVGLSSGGKIVKKSYLDKLVKDPKVLKEMKDLTLKSITRGVSLNDYKRRMKTLVTGNESVNGAMVRHFDTFATDTYNQFDRATQKAYAVKLGLNAFRYAGGIIDTSRCFCEENNGKVFTSEEASKWKSRIGDDCGPVWNSDPYNPIEDLGGFGCRHTANFISNTEAIRARPELKGRI